MKLLSDLRAKQLLYSQYGPPVSLLKTLLTDGSLANVLFRAQEALSLSGLAPLALIPHCLNKWINGCVIGVHASFGPGFVLIHPIGVVINSSVRGGRNVWLESGVVIGDNRGKFPVLEDDIFVGSGAKIIGGVRIGSKARVGANAVVLRDVPRGATAVGIPARVLGQP
ncbi:serine acetyltransferase [Aquabacterium sp.]|uniref:serine acetyltransferase n=1 Tax=Aquabacterium sp. TaxID=1872578 RepID=UPI003D6D7705